MNGYIFFYQAKQIEVHADTLYAAKQKALAVFKPAKSKQHLVHGALAELDGTPVTHNTDILA